MKSIFKSLIVLSSLLQLTTGIACGQESVKLTPLVEQSFAGTDYGVGAIAQEFPDPVPVPVPEASPPRRGSTLHRQSGSEERFRPQRVPLRSHKRQQAPAASPGISIMNPSGYGTSWGRAGVGLGLQERTRFTEDADGVMGLGVGFGNPAKTVGVGLGITVTDLWEKPFADGTISLKLHRRLPHDMSVAAGVQGAVRWGTTDGGRSVYGVATKRFIFDRDPKQLFNQLHVSVGVGSGQFRSEDEINNDEGSVGVFGSMAVRVNQPVSAIAEWTGQDMTVGLSIAPFRNLPVVISPALTDITGSAGDGTRFILGIGYGFSFPTNF